VGLVPLFAVFAVGLAIAAFRTKDRFIRIMCTVFCLANIFGVAKALYTDDPHAFRPYPADQRYDPDDHLRR